MASESRVMAFNLPIEIADYIENIENGKRSSWVTESLKKNIPEKEINELPTFDISDPTRKIYREVIRQNVPYPMKEFSIKSLLEALGKVDNDLLRWQELIQNDCKSGRCSIRNEKIYWLLPPDTPPRSVLQKIHVEQVAERNKELEENWKLLSSIVEEIHENL